MKKSDLKSIAERLFEVIEERMDALDKIYGVSDIIMAEIKEDSLIFKIFFREEKTDV